MTATGARPPVRHNPFRERATTGRGFMYDPLPIAHSHVRDL
jgi:hypothetical protein